MYGDYLSKCIIVNWMGENNSHFHQCKNIKIKWYIFSNNISNLKKQLIYIQYEHALHNTQNV
jgi:hypothetical protein